VNTKCRSKCPVSFALDIFGDKWSLLILRDIIIFGKSNYHEFASSEEGISTNILADRLIKLETHGLVKKLKDQKNLKKFIYSPTEKALDLIPLIIEMIQWSAKYDPNTAAPPEVINEINKSPKRAAKKIRDRFN
jgi:DNA-binding HxlR family transcriptional regulator